MDCLIIIITFETYSNSHQNKVIYHKHVCDVNLQYLIQWLWLTCCNYYTYVGIHIQCISYHWHFGVCQKPSFITAYLLGIVSIYHSQHYNNIFCIYLYGLLFPFYLVNYTIYIFLNKTLVYSDVATLNKGHLSYMDTSKWHQVTFFTTFNPYYAAALLYGHKIGVVT